MATTDLVALRKIENGFFFLVSEIYANSSIVPLSFDSMCACGFDII